MATIHQLLPPISSSKKVVLSEPPNSVIDEKIKNCVKNWLSGPGFLRERAQKYLEVLSDSRMICASTHYRPLFKEGSRKSTEAIPSPQEIAERVEQEGSMVIAIKDRFNNIWLVASRGIHQATPEGTKMTIASVGACLGKKEGTFKQHRFHIVAAPSEIQLVPAEIQRTKGTWFKSSVNILSINSIQPPITSRFSIFEVGHEIGKWLGYADTWTNAEHIFSNPNFRQKFNPMMQMMYSLQQQLKQEQINLTKKQQAFTKVKRSFDQEPDWNALEQASLAWMQWRKYEGIYQSLLVDIKTQTEEYLNSTSADSISWRAIIGQPARPPLDIIIKTNEWLVQKFQEAYPLPERPSPLNIERLSSNKTESIIILLCADPKLYEDVLDPLFSRLVQEYHYCAYQYKNSRRNYPEWEQKQKALQEEMIGRSAQLTKRMNSWCRSHYKLQTIPLEKIKRISTYLSVRWDTLYGISLHSK